MSIAESREGSARGDGYRIGFGDCAGQLLPAADLPEWAKE